MSLQFKTDNPQPFDSLGLFTYLRTYARRHDEENPHSTIESWKECLTRVVNATNTQLNVGFTAEEQQELFDILYNLKASVAGRFLWQLGTRTVDKLGLMSLQNCAFTVIDEPVKPFTWIMNFLMLGAGCGYRISREDVAKFPIIKRVDIIRTDVKDADFIVPDSRQGWIKLLGKVMKAHFYSGQGFTYSCHLLRSKGAVIKGFGGLSSGPEVLCEGLAKISELLNENADKNMTSVLALDICNLIGKIVVSGNVRRCLPHYAQIHTQVDGKPSRVPLEDIKVGDLVLTTRGYRKVLNKFDQGNQRIIRINLENGGLFECTTNHRMAVYNFDYLYPRSIRDITSGKVFTRYTWKQAYQLIKGDCLVALEYGSDMLPSGFTPSSPVKNVDIVNCNKFAPNAELLITSQNFCQTYDIEVEEMHEFFCEGLLTHNSAQIALGDATDKEYLQAKRWDLGNVPNWRCYSNNSVICNDISEIIDNEDFWQGYNGNGEPYGLINLKLSRSCGRLGETWYTDLGVDGYNPCAEQSLERNECCTLAEVYLPNISSFEELIKVTRHLYRICKHSLTLPCPDSKETEQVVHKNMRMGIGMTGYLQATEKQRGWLNEAYKSLRAFDVEYSSLKGFPRSIKLSTVKPSGTLSILGHCTAGVHPGFSRYYIRRIRIASESKLINVAKEHGYHIENVLNFDGTPDYTTKVIEFPYSLPEHTILAENCSAIEQMEFVKRLQTEWSDNAVSVTVYYRKEELPEIKEWLRNNYNDNVKTISFLLHSDHGFRQAPLEKITKERYEEMVRNTRPIVSTDGICHNADDEKNIGEECVSGVCPMR